MSYLNDIKIHWCFSKGLVVLWAMGWQLLGFGCFPPHHSQRLAQFTYWVTFWRWFHLLFMCASTCIFVSVRNRKTKNKFNLQKAHAWGSIVDVALSQTVVLWLSTFTRHSLNVIFTLPTEQCSHNSRVWLQHWLHSVKLCVACTNKGPERVSKTMAAFYCQCRSYCLDITLNWSCYCARCLAWWCFTFSKLIYLILSRSST